MRRDKDIGKTIIQVIVDGIFQNILDSLFESVGLIWIFKFMMFVRIGFQMLGCFSLLILIYWMLLN